MKYLVMDIDDTMIFNNAKTVKGKKKYRIQPRPHLLSFLKELKKYYKLGVFTAGNESYCEYVLDKIDKKRKYFNLKFNEKHLRRKKKFRTYM